MRLKIRVRDRESWDEALVAALDLGVHVAPNPRRLIIGVEVEESNVRALRDRLSQCADVTEDQLMGEPDAAAG